VSAEAIQELNPELRRWTTPVRATDYQLNVPEGTGTKILAALTTAEPDELVSFSRYSVKKGETISTIAKKLKVSRTDLAEANYLSTKARLDAGQQLIIPRAPTTILAARTETPAPVAESRSVDAVTASDVRPPAVQNASAASGVTRVTHRVKRGETLLSIAKLYETTVTALKQVEPHQRQRHQDRPAADDSPRRRHELILRTSPLDTIAGTAIPRDPCSLKSPAKHASLDNTACVASCSDVAHCWPCCGALPCSASMRILSTSK
jgi:LysM repeat protein